MPFGYEAIETAYPQATVQLCIVHLVRHSWNYVGWKRRAEVAADLKTIYQAATVDEAEQYLAEFEAKGNERIHPSLRSGDATGIGLAHFLTIPLKSDALSTPPMPWRDGKAALNRFTIQFEERMAAQ